MQRLLEIAIALALRPRVLLLDEPAAGVPTSEARLIEEALSKLPEEIAILIIDHDVDLIFRVSQQVTVRNEGRVLVQGTPDQIAQDERVKSIYLGQSA